MYFRRLITGLMISNLTQVGFAADDDSARIILKLKPAITLSSLKTELKQTVNLPFSNLEQMAGSFYVLTLDAKKFPGIKKTDSMNALLRTLRKNPNIAYALRDRKGYFNFSPTTKFADDNPLVSHETQWNEFSPPAGIMLESAAGLMDGAWAYTRGQAQHPIVVAILDTGVSLHPGLVNSLLRDEKNQILGWNFSANNAELSDQSSSYHGTHITGIVASYSELMRGVGENLKILPLKIPDAEGLFYESQVINALYWAVGASVPGLPQNRYPAKVINISFGIDENIDHEVEHCDPALQEAVEYVRKQGAVIIAAAGNDNSWEKYSAPAICKKVIKVTATGPTGHRTAYSNYGPSISFAAPGGDQSFGRAGGILSTVNPGSGYMNSGFEFLQGTSMASPHAAGVAGLIYSLSKPNISSQRVEQLLFATTHAFNQTNDTNRSCVGGKSCGSGILDANNAVKAAIAEYDKIITVPLAPAADTRKWVRFKNSGKVQWGRPQLSQTKEGKIIADYGNFAYRFDDSEFKHCEIIGTLGIGCYR